jgi:Cys-rich protein (TIGR01571 family)
VLRPGLLPCVVYGSNAQRFAALDASNAPLPASMRDACSYECAGFACVSLVCAGACLGASLRGRVRDRYGIAGSGAEDCVAAALLWPCQLHQEARELELEERCAGRLIHSPRVHALTEGVRSALADAPADWRAYGKPRMDYDDDLAASNPGTCRRAPRGSPHPHARRAGGWNPFVPTSSDIGSTGMGACCACCAFCALCCA